MGFRHIVFIYIFHVAIKTRNGNIKFEKQILKYHIGMKVEKLIKVMIRIRRNGIYSRREKIRRTENMWTLCEFPLGMNKVSNYLSI